MKRFWGILLAAMVLLTVVALAENAGIMPLNEPHEHWRKCSEKDKDVCSQCGEPYTGPKITHVYDENYQHNASGHWLECVCGEEQKDPVPHWRYCDEAVCYVCKESYTDDNTQHKTTTPGGDENNHWKVCTNPDCQAITDVESHSRGCATFMCSYCGAAYTGDNVTFHEGEGYNSSDSEHWKACAACETELGAHEPHTVPCTGVCTVCRKTGLPAGATHVGNSSGAYGSDANGHWQICDGCQQQINNGPHSLDEDGLCSVCGYRDSTVTETPSPTDDPDASESPTPTTDPDASESPTPTTDPDASESPTPTTDPDASESPTPTTDPDASESPTPTTDPDASESPTPTTNPDAEASPTPTTNPDAEESPTPTTAPDASETPVPTAEPDEAATPAPTAEPEQSASPTPTAAPDASPSPAPTTTPVRGGGWTATPAHEQEGDGFLTRFRSNSALAADGDILSGTTEETVTLVMEAAEEPGYTGSVLIVYGTDARDDGVLISLSSQYEPEGMLTFPAWQEGIREIDDLRGTEAFGSFVDLAQALIQALLPERSAEDVDAIIVAILRSGFDGTLESGDMSAVTLDEDIEGTVAGHLVQDGYEFILVLRDDSAVLLVREAE